jgi:hypothetical protein
MLLHPVKEKALKYEKILMLYMFVGLLVVGGLAVIFAIKVSSIVSIILGILYFGGLVFLMIKTKKLTSGLVLKTHFNLAIILKNENERFYYKYGLKARPGYLAKWIEIHCVCPLSISGEVDIHEEEVKK